MAKSSNKAGSGTKLFAKNRKAFHDYEILEKYEAGIVLKGAEVKSIKYGMVNLRDSFVSIDKGEAWLWNCHVSQWTYSSDPNYDPIRKRKVLLKKSEIDTLTGKIKQKGLALIPLKLYGVRGRIKIELGLGRGLKKYDKRRKQKERELDRELREEKKKYMV